MTARGSDTGPLHPAPRRGQPPDFKIAVPEQRPRGGDRPLPSQASSGPLPHPSRFARRVSCSTPSHSRVSIILTRMAQSRRQGQETRRGRQRVNKRSRRVQLPHPHALCPRRPQRLAPVTERAGAPRSPGDAGTSRSRAPRSSLGLGINRRSFPLGEPGSGKEGPRRGKKGLHLLSVTLPSSLRWGPRGREGGGRRERKR